MLVKGVEKGKSDKFLLEGCIWQICKKALEGYISTKGTRAHYLESLPPGLLTLVQYKVLVSNLWEEFSSGLYAWECNKIAIYGISAFFLHGVYWDKFFIFIIRAERNFIFFLLQATVVNQTGSQMLGLREMHSLNDQGISLIGIWCHG